MMKEEQMLFPYLVALDDSARQKSAPPRAPFGTVQNPVRMMAQEHDDAGHLLKEIRSLTADFTAPADACPSFKVLYQGLEAFEADLRMHIALIRRRLKLCHALPDFPRPQQTHCMFRISGSERRYIERDEQEQQDGATL